MKKLKTVRWVLALACCAVFLFSSVGLMATWNYSLSAPETINIGVNIKLFEWKGSVDLPNDVAGENHRALIESILDGVVTDSSGNEVQIGLNNPDSYISEEIASRSGGGSWWATSDTLGSMDYWERENINQYFDLDTTNLTFVLYFPDGVSDTYYLYTTSLDLGGTNAPNFPLGEKVYPVYRTTLKMDESGEWAATETKTGYALSAYYDNRITGSTFVKYPSIDPSSWVEAVLGTTVDDAIPAFVGETTTAYIKHNEGALYYSYKPSSQTTTVVSSELANAVIRVYDASMNLVTVASGAQASNSLTFVANANTQYYIQVGGAESVTFSIIKA